MTSIIRDGFFFRVANEATGYRSMAMTSASQAGALIRRKFGVAAYDAAVAAFIAANKATS